MNLKFLKVNYSRFNSLAPASWLLLLLILVGLILRVTGLTVQSLWIDELHTMHESSPKHTLSQIFYFLQTGIHDPHPPFYFLIIHYWFKLIGYSDFSARLLSALTGTLSIYIIFRLGKELYNRNVGLMAAVLTTFNYFNLYYSQEARNYIFSFLFSCLSFYYLVKALRQPSAQRNILYGIATLALLYTHYYGFAILGAQILIILIALILDIKNFKKQFLLFMLSGLVILVGYLPWISTLFSIGKMPSFWLQAPQSDFFVGFFTEYFGYQYILIYLYAVLFLVFLINVFIKPTEESEKNIGVNGKSLLLSDRLLFSFLVLMTWIIVSYLIPYVRSLISTPMLFGRYSIVTLPAILIAIAIGIEVLPSKMLKVYIVLFAVLITLIDLFPNKKYYTTPVKQQFREAAAFVKEKGENFPIITDQEAYYRYYFEKMGMNPAIIYPTPDFFKSYTSNIWVVSCWQTKPVGAGQQVLDSAFKVVKEYNGIDTWAKLYAPKGNRIALNGGNILGDGSMAMWANLTINSSPVMLEKGKHQLVINAYGSPAKGQNAHVKVYKEDTLLTEYYLEEVPADKYITFEQPTDSEVVFKIEFDNDAFDPEKSQDRNAFVRTLEVK